jgi:Spy/CpxP family protein refolding chaperone
MKLQAALLLLFAMAPVSFAADKNAQYQNPVMWGTLSQNTGCVIFKEGHKTSGMFWGVAITTKTVGKLTVIETQNYTLDQDEYLETQENMDDLMLRAEKDHIKFIKIPEKYTPKLLERAHAMCQ